MSALPPADWLKDWIRAHCKATGGGVEVAELLHTNREIIVDTWRATAEELRTCTHRLIARCETPQFPPQHLDAVGLELVALRDERNRPAADLPTDQPTCALCGNTGLVVVVHPLCLFKGRVVTSLKTGKVMSASVLCDQCGIGRRLVELRRGWRHQTFGDAVIRAGGLDVAALWREYEQQQARYARGGLSAEDRLTQFAETYPRLTSLVTG